MGAEGEDLREYVRSLEHRIEELETERAQDDGQQAWVGTPKVSRRATIAGLAGLLGLGGMASSSRQARASHVGEMCNWLVDVDANQHGLYHLGELLFDDLGADPDENGLLKRNGADVKVYSGGAVRNLSNIGSGGGGSPGGADTQLQYNDGGSFGGIAGFTYDDVATEISAVPAIAAHLLPEADATRDLGAAGTRWRDIYGETATTERVENSDLNDGLNYINPQWAAQFFGAFFITHYNTLDNFGQVTSGSGSITGENAYITLSTGGTNGSTVELYRVPSRESYPRTWDNGRTIRFGLMQQATGNGTSYHVTGNVHDGNAGFGFRIDNQAVKGVTHDNTTENAVDLSHTISTNALDPDRLDARLIPGTRVEYRINGTLIDSATSNIPTGSNGNPQWLLAHYVENNEAVDRAFRTSDWRTVMEP